MRDAFLAVLAEDGVLFRPGPVNGREWFESIPPPPGVLAWDPVHAEVSKAGDLGYTTGPWRYDLDGRDAVFGHYVSIWRRAKNDSWRLVVDIGIGHGEPERSAWAPAIDEQQGGERTQAAAPGSPRPPRKRVDRSRRRVLTRGGRERAGRGLRPRRGQDDPSLSRRAFPGRRSCGRATGARRRTGSRDRPSRWRPSSPGRASSDTATGSVRAPRPTRVAGTTSCASGRATRTARGRSCWTWRPQRRSFTPPRDRGSVPTSAAATSLARC